MKNSNYRKNTDNTGRKNQSSVIALGGICLALTLAFLFAGSVAPGIELTLFALSSLFTAVMVLESGVGAAARPAASLRKRSAMGTSARRAIRAIK